MREHAASTSIGRYGGTTQVRSNAPRRAISIKSRAEVESMRRAGRIVDLVLRTLIDACRPAVTTDELEQIGGRIIKQEGGEPLFLDHAAGGDVPPYPAPVCISVNEEVVHGIPGD